MRNCFIDFETRSTCDLRVAGSARYAEDGSTTALMLAAVVDDEDLVRQWVYDKSKPANAQDIPPWLLELVEDESVIFHAHNAAFERDIWTRCLLWPNIPLERWRCTAARAAYANMPRSLDKLCERLELSQKKDKRGKQLIGRISVPQKIASPTVEKGRYAIDTAFEIDDRDGLFRWREDAVKAGQIFDDEFQEFLDYNAQDVVAERAADAALPEMPRRENLVWAMDRRINERGFPIDVDLCEGAKRVYADALIECNQEIAQITGIPDITVSADLKTKRWIATTGYNWPSSHDKNAHIPEPKLNKIQAKNRRLRETEPYRAYSLSEETVERELSSPDMEYYPDLKRVLTLRLEARSAAVTKYLSALDHVCHDGRIRNSLRYYGAPTGRWAGMGFHPHNLYRATIPPEFYYESIATGDIEQVKNWLPLKDKKGKTIATNPIELLKICTRGIIKAPEGKVFVISDFAGIEARVLHWMFDNERMTQQFRDAQDVYIDAATEIYHVLHEDIAVWDVTEKKWKIKPEHYEKRQMGKIRELGLGYGMGPGKLIETAAKDGVTLEAEFAEDIVRGWRESNHKVVNGWRMLQKACQSVAKNHKPVRAGRFIVSWHDAGYLCIRLPSGRTLFYYRMEDFYSSRLDSKSLRYIDGSKAGYTGWTETYGGKLTENVCQAIARDLLVCSMALIERAGYDVIFHAHDETVSEVDEDTVDAAKDAIHNAMQTVPKWAAGLPLSAETHISRRFTK